MSVHHVLVADPLAEKGLEELRATPGIEVEVKVGLSEAELIALAPRYAAIIVRSGVKITAPVIEAGKGVLKAIGRAGVGVDNIDIPAATRHGVVVMNTPGGNTVSTAEHAFTLMMSLARHIPQAHRSVAEGRFKEGRKAYSGVELYHKTLAILGMGRIGTEFARRAMAFGMRVVVYDPYLAASKAKSLRVELCDTVDDAVAQADFITLHLPKTKETTHLINRERIEKMKAGVRIVNCARGGLIDEKALIEGLDNGKIAGAALDVFETEPPSPDDPLLGREDVVLTPHLGASTEEAQENVGIEIALAIRDTLINGTVVNAVNMPNIDEKTLSEIGAYLKLAETLGRLSAQVAPAQPSFFRINYSGKVAEVDTTLIARSALKGYLEVGAGEGSVNYLNAPTMAESRGMRVTESRAGEACEFTDLIEVAVGNEQDETKVAGTFFGSLPRIVKLGDRFVEVTPEGCLLLFENTDAPGMIGQVGKWLGDHGVNIASMSLGRDQSGGTAISVLNLDSAPSPEIVQGLLKIPGIHDARLVTL